MNGIVQIKFSIYVLSYRIFRTVCEQLTITAFFNFSYQSDSTLLDRRLRRIQEWWSQSNANSLKRPGIRKERKDNKTAIFLKISASFAYLAL